MSIGTPLPPVEQARRDRWLKPARLVLSEGVQTQAHEQGWTRSQEQAIAHAREAGGQSLDRPHLGASPKLPSPSTRTISVIADSDPYCSLLFLRHCGQRGQRDS